jgi:hypothetical protein
MRPAHGRVERIVAAHDARRTLQNEEMFILSAPGTLPGSAAAGCAPSAGAGIDPGTGRWYGTRVRRAISPALSNGLPASSG